MPVIQGSLSIAAGATIPNLISGSAFEFARGAQLVSMGIVASAAGLQVGITSGADLISEEFEAAVKTTYPIIPDEMYYTDVMAPGDRLVLRARNTSGAPITARWVIQIAGAG